MSKDFETIKKKSLISAILKSLAVGGSVFLAAAGILLLVFSLTDAIKNLKLGAIIGIGCASGAGCLILALAAGGVAFLFLRPTDMKVAKRYDDEFALNEKLQTMVAFKGQEGTMIDLQRQNALEILSTLPNPKVKFSRIWQYVASLALAVCVAFSGAGVAMGVAIAEALNHGHGNGPGQTEIPPDIDPENPDNDLFEYELGMQAGMAEIINDVRDSTVEDGTKQYMVAALEALDETLRTVTTVTQMRLEVFAAVTDIDEFIEQSNSFRKISKEVEEFDKNLSSAITKGFVVYKGRIIPSLPISYVSGLSDTLGDYIEDAMADFIEESGNSLHVSQITLGEEKNLSEVLDFFTASMEGALTVSGISEEDALYDSLITLSTQLKSIKRQTASGGTGDSVLWERIDDCYSIMNKSAVAALIVQAVKPVMEVYIRQQLTKLFNISFSGVAELYADLVYEVDKGPGGVGPSEGDDPENPPGGGAGPGDIKYGSNDLIYYPKTGTFEKFGDVLSDYEDAIRNGTLEEDFPEYLKNYFEKYLNYLHNGTGETDGSEN